MALRLKMVVVPLGCITASKALFPKPVEGEAEIRPLLEEQKPALKQEAAELVPELVPAKQTLSSVAPTGEKGPLSATEKEAHRPRRKTG